jgi:DNA-binding response OmpR family regulator
MSIKAYKVVLVEDNDDDADLVARGVRRYSHSAEFVRIKTIPLAIEHLKNARDEDNLPDLVLVDGRIDGVEASEFFRELAIADLTSVSCVVLSGSVETNSFSGLLEKGAREVKWKPVDYSEFLDEIGRIMQQFHPTT